MGTQTTFAATALLAAVLGFCVLCSSSSALEVSDANYVVEPYATYSHSGLQSPKHMAFDGSGNLYVTHTYSSCMWRIPPNGKAREFLTGFQAAGVEWGGGTLLGDYLYVIECSTHDGTLYRIDSNGQKTTVASWDGPRHGAGALRLDRVGNYGGHLFVATTSQDRICELPLNAQISDFSPFPGWYNGGGPGDIAFDPGELYEGLMYVTVAYNGENQHRGGVFLLDAGGKARRFAKEIVAARRMRFDPTGDFHGQLFVVGATGYGQEDKLYRLAPDGTAEEFARANGTLGTIIFGPDDALYVAEYDKGDQATIISRVVRKPAGHVNTDRLDDALAYHWSFDNEDAVDSVRGEKGQVVGDVRFAQGILGKAPVFKNHSTKIVVQSPEFSTDGWKQATFSAWLKSSHYRNYGYAIGGAEGNQGSGFSFTLGKSAAGFVPYLAGGRRLTTRLLRRESDFDFQTGVWYHLVGTYDGHRSRFYINGNLEAETVAEEPGLPLSDLPNARLVLGRAAGTRYDTWYDTYFPGPIDELKIWKRAMSGAEVKQLYQHTLQQSQENEAASEFQVDYAGLRWDLMRTGWKVENGRLASQRHARPGFQYGHSANGRNGLAITGIGDKSWVDYEVAFDFKMLPANQEFFHAHIPGDSRGMSVIFRAKSLEESWNQPHTCYSFGLRPSGKWSMGVSEDYYMPGYGWSATRKGKTEKLSNGTAEFCQDASEGRLRLRVKGNTITVWLNDEQLVKHKHKGEVVDPIPYGGFGVGWRYESMGWISHLEVKKL